MTPALAMTSHAAQGQTFSKGAIVDLCIGGSSSTMSSCVAITRVERREDLLIYRCFPLHLFNKGQKPGMELLLRVWRNDDTIDWKAIEDEHMPSKKFGRAIVWRRNNCIQTCSGSSAIMMVTWLAVVSRASRVLYCKTGHASALHAGIIYRKQCLKKSSANGNRFASLYAFIV